MVWTDDPNGFSENVRAVKPVDLGSADNRLGTVYANVINGTTVVGDPLLANNDFLEATDAAGTGTVGLVKLDATDDTVINASTGNIIKFSVNDVAIGNASATALTYPIYNLSDGSEKNHNISTTASGTAYTLTNTSAAVAFGTSTPSLVLDKAGVYLIAARFNLEYVGATFAANRTVTVKLRRTNNTAADLTGATTGLGTNIVTTVSGVMSAGVLPLVFYTTANTNDIVVFYADVSVAPSAGSLQMTEANIVAFRISA